MKSFILILTAGLILSASAQAQKKHVQKKKSTVVVKVKVPQNIDSSFKIQYASVADGKWSKNYSGNYVADFTNQTSMKQSVEYDKAGYVIKTKTFFDSSAIPMNVTTALQKNYSTAKVTEVAKVEIPGVAPYYMVNLWTAENKKRQLLISEEGTVSE
ncbi:MAG: PepSY-like domain-containing protein [Ferruginibacter sp.]